MQVLKDELTEEMEEEIREVIRGRYETPTYAHVC